MKSILFLGALLATLPAAAQKKPAKPAPKATAVSAATVARVVKTLAADDMQGRGTGQPGGLKAAQFLAAEFKRIGLQPLPGQPDFEQTLTVYQGLTSPVAAVINGQTMAPLQAVAISGQPTLRWANEDAEAPAVVVIGPEPAEHLGHIFEKFYRMTAVDRVTGTGLGCD